MKVLIMDSGRLHALASLMGLKRVGVTPGGELGFRWQGQGLNRVLPWWAREIPVVATAQLARALLDDDGSDVDRCNARCLDASKSKHYLMPPQEALRVREVLRNQ